MWNLWSFQKKKIFCDEEKKRTSSKFEQLKSDIIQIPKRIQNKNIWTIKSDILHRIESTTSALDAYYGINWLICNWEISSKKNQSFAIYFSGLK